MTSVIAVCNLKGGAGKSTIAVNLACQLAEITGSKCALVDADRQGTARAWGRNGNLPITIHSRVLDEARVEDRYPGMIWISQIREIAENCQYLFIDLPAGLQYSLAAVTAVSDLIVAPVSPSGVDIHSTRQFIDLISRTREIRGTGKPECVIVPNRIDSRTTVARDLSVYDQFGERTSQPIHARKILADAFDAGSWVGEIDPGSSSSREFQNLASLILQSSDDPAAPEPDKPEPVISQQNQYPHLSAANEIGR
jgi:chromosome partitioning protein